MSLLIKGIDIPKDVHGETVLDDIRLIFSNANTRFSIPLNKDDIIEIPTPHGRLKEELEKKLYEYVDPFEVPGALEACYDTMEAFYDAMDRFTKGE